MSDQAQHELELSHAVVAERLERRLAAVLRQLEHRISDAERLERENALLSEEACRLRGEQARLEEIAAEHDALLATKSIRALALPRRIYAVVRRIAHPA